MSILVKKNRPVLTVHTGDEHVGSTVALMPPNVETDDGGSYQASVVQQWYWQCWLEFWKDTERLKRQYNAEVVYIHGGDEGEGDHHGTRQIWFVSDADQERAIEAVFAVAAKVVDSWVWVRSTEAHDGPSSAGTEQRAERMARQGANVVRNGALYSHWIYTGIHGGVRFQVKHQPQTRGHLLYTRDLAAGRQALLTWEGYAEDQIDPPDICVWHHVHYRARGWFRNTFCYVCPPWQLPTSWSMGKLQSSPHIEWPGGMRFLCRDGDWQPFELRFRPESGVAWARK